MLTFCAFCYLSDNCDLHLKVAPDGLSGKPLEDEGFSYLLAGVRATWGVTKGKVCFECKVGVLQIQKDRIIIVFWEFEVRSFGNIFG